MRPVDPSQSGRLEAMLGPASAQFGSDAMGGAIHVLTPQVQLSTSNPWTANDAFNLFAGSADKARGADASLFLSGRQVAGLVGVSRRQLGDLRAGGGRDSNYVLYRLFGLDRD